MSFIHHQGHLGCQLVLTLCCLPVVAGQSALPCLPFHLLCRHCCSPILPLQQGHSLLICDAVYPKQEDRRDKKRGMRLHCSKCQVQFFLKHSVQTLFKEFKSKPRFFKKCLVQKTELQELLHFPTIPHFVSWGHLSRGAFNTRQVHLNLSQNIFISSG